MENILENLSQFISEPGVFPTLFIATWVAISYGLSRDSVWAKLKTKYSYLSATATSDGKEPIFHSATGSLGKARFEGIMHVAATDAGILLKMRFPMNIGHPTLQIPWPQISDFEVTSSSQSRGAIAGLNLTGSIRKKSRSDAIAMFKLIEFPELALVIPWHEKLNAQLPSSSSVSMGTKGQVHDQ